MEHSTAQGPGAIMREGSIALLDILGWKGIWQRKSNVAIDDLLKLVNNARNKKQDIDEGKYSGLGIFNDVTINVISISDTIAIVVDGKPENAIPANALLCASTVILSLHLGIPVRGAMSYGKYWTSESILLGPAVDEVASWYEQSDWIGVHLTPSAFLKYGNLDYKSLLVSYDVPSKGVKIPSTIACNWPTYFTGPDRIKGDKSDLLRESLLKLGPLTSDIANKIMNTIKFYEANKYVVKDK